VLRTWFAELSPSPHSPLFPGRTGGGRLSRDAVEMLVAKQAATAEAACPSVKEKNVTPHTLRHTAAMFLQFESRDGHLSHCPLARPRRPETTPRSTSTPT